MAQDSPTSPAISAQAFRKETSLPPSLNIHYRSFFPLEDPPYPTNDVDFDEWTDYAAYCGLHPEPLLLNLLSNEENASLDKKYFTPQLARPIAIEIPSAGVLKMQGELGLHSDEIAAAQQSKKPASASLIVKFKLPTEKVAKILSMPKAPGRLQAGDRGNSGEKEKSAHENTRVLRPRR